MDTFSLPVSQIANDAFEANIAGPVTFQGIIPSQLQNRRFFICDDGTSLDGKSSKLIQDPIHGAYRLEPACVAFIDTPEFQRLRRLRQLGMAYFVFPGASHCRFEHSLGVAHLAGRYSSQILSSQFQELDAGKEDIRLITLAGLCHDLGHGPFSHCFEKELLPKLKVTNWEHEEMSVKMLDHIIDSHHIDFLPDDGPKRIKNFILAGHSMPSSWMDEIVANGRNSIDVDKFDYLQRDSKYCGASCEVNFSRIMQFARVIDNEICFKYSEYMTLFQLFTSRATMHRTVYTHRKSKAIEFMVVDALAEAEPALRIADRIHDPKDFYLLDDQLLDQIEKWELITSMPGVGNIDEGVHSAMRASQNIISRLRKRKLYKFVADCVVPTDVLLSGHWRAPSPSDIASHCKSSDVNIQVDDVIIHECKIDHSMKNKNPLDHVHFYNSVRDASTRTIKKDSVSQMFADAFVDVNLRVYSKNADPMILDALHEAFDFWIKERFGGKVEASTPAKRPLDRTVGNGGVKRGRELLFGDEKVLDPA